MYMYLHVSIVMYMHMIYITVSGLKTGVVAHGCMVVPTAKGGGLKKDAYIEYLYPYIHKLYIRICTYTYICVCAYSLRTTSWIWFGHRGKHYYTYVCATTDIMI